MNKSVLEKRIEERSEERFNKEFMELVKYIANHPIGKSLTVTIDGNEIPVANFGGNYGLLNDEGIKSKFSKNTNLQMVRERLLEKYKQKETDELLEKLDNLRYLFD